jgi:hypothetical protein
MTHLTPLDPRFPVRLDADAPEFWRTLRTWPDPATVVGQTAAAIAQAARREERFTVPADPGRYYLT